MVSGFGFRGPGFGFRVLSFEYRVPGSGFRVSSSEFRISGSAFRVSGFGFRFSVFGFRASWSGSQPLQRARAHAVPKSSDDEHERCAVFGVRRVLVLPRRERACCAPCPTPGGIDRW